MDNWSGEVVEEVMEESVERQSCILSSATSRQPPIDVSAEADLAYLGDLAI